MTLRAGEFNPFEGAIAWTNLDEDEERIGADNVTPVSDSIRFYLDGITFEHSDEDWMIAEMERSFEAQLPGYVAPPWAVRSPLPDIYPLYIPYNGVMPRNCRILLKVKDAEMVRAFHLYPNIPDFDKGHPSSKAIWGAFDQNPASPPEGFWVGQDHVVDDTTIDITRWVNPNADEYEGKPFVYFDYEPTAVAHMFGIEAMLYRGMRYDFSEGDEGETFDGLVEFELIIEDENGVEIFWDTVVLTFLRLPAFPGAQGFGRWASGGRGGEVYVVENLGDSGEGSLREGVEDRKYILDGNGEPTERFLPRTIVFNDSGLLSLSNTLGIRKGKLTLAGQKAPGRGVTIDGRGLPDNVYDASGNQTNESDPAVVIGGIKNPKAPLTHRSANNVIMRFLRSRRGDHGNPKEDKDQSGDALVIKSASDVIVDHCSFSWGDDGVVDIVQHDKTGLNEQPEMDVTMQWCFLYQGLNKHSKANLVRGRFGARYSIHHNMYGHNHQRNPELGMFRENNIPTLDKGRLAMGMLTEFTNNMIWNWKEKNAGYSSNTTEFASGYLRFQFIGNTYDQGPSLESGVEAKMFKIGAPNQITYFEDNLWDGSPLAASYGRVTGFSSRRFSRFITEMGPSDIQSAAAAYSDIKIHGGCSRPSRDDTDLAYLAERALVDEGTSDGTFGIVEFVSHNPVLTPFAPGPGGAVAYTDSDDDGMDDAWEEENMKPVQSHTDFHPWQDPDGDGWTNLEEFLNGTDPRLGDDPQTLEFKLFESNP